MSRIIYVFASARNEEQLESDIDVLQRLEIRALTKYGHTRSLRYKCFSNIIENRVVHKINELFYIRLRKFDALDVTYGNGHSRKDGTINLFQRLWNKHRAVVRNHSAFLKNRSKNNGKESSTVESKNASEKSSGCEKNTSKDVEELHTIRRLGWTPKRPGVPQMGYLHRFKPAWAKYLLTRKHAFNTDDAIIAQPEDAENIPSSDDENDYLSSSSTSHTVECTDGIQIEGTTTTLIQMDVESDAKDALYMRSEHVRNTKLKRLKRYCSNWTWKRLKIAGLIL